MKRVTISRGGQISVPSTIRNRWGTKAVLFDDRGDHVVLKPAPDDPITAFRGALKGRLDGSADELRERARADARASEDRRFGPS